MRKEILNISKLLIVLVTIITSISIASASYLSAYGHALNEGARSIVKLSNGSFAITGYTTSDGAGGYDLLVSGFNTSGDINWNKVLGGSVNEHGFGIIKTSDNGFVVVGDTTSFGPAYYNFFIVKLNASGGIIWAKALGTAGEDVGYSVIESSDGGYIVAGYGFVTHREIDVFIVKLNSSGDLEYVKAFGGSFNDKARFISATSDGGFIITGEVSMPSGEDYALVAKFNSSADLEWADRLGGTSTDYGNAVVELSDGSFIAVGSTFSYVTGNQKIFIAKINSTGGFQWIKSINKSMQSEHTANSVAATSDGGFVIGGTRVFSGESHGYALITKFDSEGHEEWSKTFGKAGTGSSAIWGVSELSNGDYLAAGLSYSFGVGGSDIVIARFNNSGCISNCDSANLTSYSFDWVNISLTHGSVSITGASPSITSQDVSPNEINPVFNKTVVCKGITLPIYSNFISFPHTTNFSAVPDITNVTNLTLQMQHGYINFPINYSVNAEGQDYDTNVIFGDCYVSVNTSALDPSFNASSYLSFNNSDGHCGDNHIYMAPGVYNNADAIRQQDIRCEDCIPISFSNGHLIKFKVFHFTGYAIGSNANLTIYDNYEGSSAQPNADIIFYANYTNKSGSHISGVTCTIYFDGNTADKHNMTDNGNNYNYTYSFSSAGTHNYNITCSATGYNTLSVVDDVNVESGVVPEFSLSLLFIVSVAALMIFIVVRTRL